MISSGVRSLLAAQLPELEKHQHRVPWQNFRLTGSLFELFDVTKTPNMDGPGLRNRARPATLCLRCRAHRWFEHGRMVKIAGRSCGCR